MRTWMILAVGFALLAIAAPVLAQTRSADEAAIRKLVESFAPAWARGDASALAAAYTTDADYASSTGFTANGRAEIEKAYFSQLSGVYKGTSLKQLITNIRFLTSDVALVNATFEVTGLRGSDGREAPPRRGMNTSILVRMNGEWLLTAHRGWVPSSASPADAK